MRILLALPTNFLKTFLLLRITEQNKAINGLFAQNPIDQHEEGHIGGEGGDEDGKGRGDGSSYADNPVYTDILVFFSINMFETCKKKHLQGALVKVGMWTINRQGWSGM